MQRIITPLIMVFLFFTTQGQTISGSFGVIADPVSNQTTFSGPVILKDVNSCLQVLNGIQKLVFTSTGRYTDCPDKTPTGISSINLWPNPASTLVRIRISKVNDPDTEVAISILDASGQVVYSISTRLGQLSSGLEIPVLNHASGMYMMRIVSPNEIHTIPFIKIKS